MRVRRPFYALMFLSHLTALNGADAFAAASDKSMMKQQATAPKPVKNAQLRKDFFRFSSLLMRWTAQALRKVEPGQPREAIAFAFTTEDFDRLVQTFEGFRELLYALHTRTDLHMVEGVDLIPQDIFNFIKARFSIAKPNQPFDKNLLLLSLVGGTRTFGAGGKAQVVQGLTDKIDAFVMSDWPPVKTFITKFEDTLTTDSGKMGRSLGRVLLPMVKHYYNYMDTTSRLRLFRELADGMGQIKFNGDHDHDHSLLATKVFQASGPVLIKFLQQLQEETKGESDISPILAALKDSTGMPVDKSKRLAMEEMVRVSGGKNEEPDSFKFEPKILGTASIAETHRIEYQGKPYVIKLLRERLKDVFQREQSMLRRMLADEKNDEDFDKGLKQTINNMIDGINEEVNFNNERSNILQGLKTYTDLSQGIQTVALPNSIGKGTPDVNLKGNSEALIMTLAPGKPLGKIMENGSGTELYMAYELVQNLYRLYLTRALDGYEKVNFYHGDLHRENIFFDANGPKGPVLTLIDFGNAGILPGPVRESVAHILRLAKQTNTASTERGQDQAIRQLGEELHQFILNQSNIKASGNHVAMELMAQYFRYSFNPSGTQDEKMAINRNLAEKAEQFDKERKKLIEELRMARGAEDLKKQRAKIAELRDNIDFVNALARNAFDGPTNPMLVILAEKRTVSEKLEVIFQEMQRNGIALPKPIIFFNKSKRLLEGIMEEIARKMASNHVSYSYVEPEGIFEKVVSGLRKGRHVQKG